MMMMAMRVKGAGCWVLRELVGWSSCPALLTFAVGKFFILPGQEFGSRARVRVRVRSRLLGVCIRIYVNNFSFKCVGLCKVMLPDNGIDSVVNILYTGVLTLGFASNLLSAFFSH